jgi:Tfp pilus assembly protein FimT
LVEALVVVGVAVIIAAVATPGFLSWRANAQLRAATECFRGDLQLAKARAVRDAQTVIVKLQSDRYRVFVDTDNGAAAVDRQTATMTQQSPSFANGNCLKVSTSKFYIRLFQLPATKRILCRPQLAVLK